MSDVTYPPDCEHPRIVTAHVTLRNGAVQVREICAQCFISVRALRKADFGTRLAGLPSVTMAKLEEKQAQYKRENSQRYLDALHAERERQHKEWLDWYSEYLSSDEWQRLRRKIIRRSSGVCEGCLERPVECIHHLTYRNVGDELCFQLVGLCHECHRRVHKDKLEAVT